MDCAEKVSFFERAFRENLHACSSFDVRRNSVLVIEANNVHGAVVPGYVRYFLDLGYNVDVFLRPKVYDSAPMCRLKNDKIRVMALPITMLRQLFESGQGLNEYKKIFFTSHFIYEWLDNGASPTIFNHFPALKKYLAKLTVVEHHFERIDAELLRQDKVITLADFNGENERSVSVVPASFGDVRVTPKSAGSPVIFIVVGEISEKHRNYSLLINTVWKLHQKGITNFMITIIGRGELDDIPKEIKRYFNIKGSVDFPTLYEAMEDADFFLPLLDPQNHHHRRYLTTGISGSFLLVYGFRKPCLIQETFAVKYGLSGENSLVHHSGKDFIKVMTRAIDMSQAEYASLQTGLERLTRGIYARSLETLKRILGDGNVLSCID
ncbi:MAG: hypothetical protein LBC93_00335 [Synergistaceae bacterium]|nr:hypothetical protein [Synergistaceae bacterium]